MIDVEDRLRAGLADSGWDRLLPADPMRWIAAETARQRRRQLPIRTAAASVAVGAVVVGAGQLHGAPSATYGSGRPEPTPSSCAGFVHPTDGVPVWPRELTAVINAAADFNQWRVTGSRSVVACTAAGFQVGAAITLVPTQQESGATLEVQRVIADHVTQAELRSIATAGLNAPDVQDGGSVQGADTSLLATSGTTRRVLVWSAASGSVVTITQSAEPMDSQAVTTSKMDGLAGSLLTLNYRTRR
jgi:hypothetical protein